jgi:hypothetical protein
MQVRKSELLNSFAAQAAVKQSKVVKSMQVEREKKF